MLWFPSEENWDPDQVKGRWWWCGGDDDDDDDDDDDASIYCCFHGFPSASLVMIRYLSRIHCSVFGLYLQMGSDVYLCYKKSMTKTNVLAYRPGIRLHWGQIIEWMLSLSFFPHSLQHHSLFLLLWTKILPLNLSSSLAMYSFVITDC